MAVRKPITVTSPSAEAVAELEAGRKLMHDFRFTEAMARFDKAIALDAGFVLAQAYRGVLTPGADGAAALEKAAAAAATRNSGSMSSFRRASRTRSTHWQRRCSVPMGSPMGSPPWRRSKWMARRTRRCSPASIGPTS